MKLSKIFLTIALLGSMAMNASAQTQKTGSIDISNRFILKDQEGRDVGGTVNFTLIKDGVAISAASLTSPTATDNSHYRAFWENIPVGSYELHCESLRFGTIIKKIGLIPGNTYKFDLTDMPDANKEVVQGGNPTLFELQNQIKELMAQIASLKTKIEGLEKAK